MRPEEVECSARRPHVISEVRFFWPAELGMSYVHGTCAGSVRRGPRYYPSSTRHGIRGEIFTRCLYLPRQAMAAIAVRRGTESSGEPQARKFVCRPLCVGLAFTVAQVKACEAPHCHNHYRSVLSPRSTSPASADAYSATDSYSSGCRRHSRWPSPPRPPASHMDGYVSSGRVCVKWHKPQRASAAR